jgi:hypothetical protein
MRSFSTVWVVSLLSLIGTTFATTQNKYLDFYEGMSANRFFSVNSARATPQWVLLKRLYDKTMMLQPRSSMTIPYHFHLICLSTPVPQNYNNLITQMRRLHPKCKITLWTQKNIATFPFANKAAFTYASTPEEKISLLCYEILNKYGGIYVDSNFEFLQPLDKLLRTTHFFGALGHAQTLELSSEIIGCAPHHPIIRKCLTCTLAGSKTDPMAIKKRSGSLHLTECFLSIAEKSPGITMALPTSYFYPIPPYEQRARGEPISHVHPPAHAYAVYHWRTDALGQLLQWPRIKTGAQHLKPDEKPLVIITLTHNNERLCAKNLHLALDQDYSNFRIILINDSSTDKTQARIFEVLTDHPRAHLVTYIKTKQRHRGMSNHCAALSLCNENEIAVHYDGDDFFPDTQVLKRINSEYQDPTTWLTWGSYINLSNNKPGFSAPLAAKNRIRYVPWVTSHLRSFYVWLFRKVHVNDFKYRNNFIPCCCDLAMMFPMVELAGSHAKYIPDILYLYNDTNPHNIYKTSYYQSYTIEKYLRQIRPYKPLLNRNSPAQK